MMYQFGRRLRDTRDQLNYLMERIPILEKQLHEAHKMAMSREKLIDQMQEALDKLAHENDQLWKWVREDIDYETNGDKL